MLTPRTDKCGGCPLFQAESNSCTHVPTRVNKRAPVDLLVITEQPTYTDDRQGEILSSDGGRSLRAAIAQAGRETGRKVNVAYTSLVRCRATTEDGFARKPTWQETMNCLPYTLRDIAKLRPSKVLTLGGVAGAALNPEFYTVADARGGKKTVPEDLVSVPGGQPELVHSYLPKVAAFDPYRRGFLEKDIQYAVSNKTLAWAKKGKAVVFRSFRKAMRFLRHLRYGLTKKDSVAFDVETSHGLSRTNNSLISIGFAVNGGTGYSIPLNHRDTPWSVEQHEALKAEMRLLFTERVSFSQWLAWNATFDVQQVHLYLGCWVTNVPVVDVMLLLWELDENRLNIQNEFNRNGGNGGAMALKRAATELLRFTHWPDNILALRNEGRLADAPLYQTCSYNAMDCYVTYRVFRWILKQAGAYRARMMRLARYIGSNAVLLISYMEWCGFKVDLSGLAALRGPSSIIAKQERKLLRALRKQKSVQKLNAELARMQSGGLDPLPDEDEDWVFDPGKPEHLQRLFFGVLRLEPVNYSHKNDWPAFLPRPAEDPPGSPSVDDKFWKRYANKKKNPEGYRASADIIHQLLELRKLKTAFIEKLGERLEDDPECWDGRVRAAFMYVQTVSGRLACRNPNLQQLPKADKSEYKAAVKNLYQAEPGCVLIHTDYSQGEVYLLGQVAQDQAFAAVLWEIDALKQEYWRTGDPALAKRIKTEGDLHRRTAALMEGKDVALVTDIERQAAKSIVFALIYGMAIFTLAKNLNCSEEEAQAKADKFFDGFPGCQAWLSAVESAAMEEKQVESLVGRVRRFPDMEGDDKRKIGRAKRQARNSPIQSLLSDITLFQAGRIVKFILKYGLPWKVVNVIHDAILVEVPYQDIQRYLQVARAIMMDFKPLERAFGFRMIVPLASSADLGIHFGRLVELGSKAHLPARLEELAQEWENLGYPVDELAQRRLTKSMATDLGLYKAAA